MAKKNGSDGAVSEREEKQYRIVSVVDGEKFERDVPLIGIPFWVPQTREEHPRFVVGTIEDIVEIPANEETGFPARTGIVLSTKDTFWVVPAGAAIERQVTELHLGAGERIMIEYAGKAKRAKAGRQPANRFNISRSAGKVAQVASGPMLSTQQRAS